MLHIHVRYGGIQALDQTLTPSMVHNPPPLMAFSLCKKVNVAI